MDDLKIPPATESSSFERELPEMGTHQAVCCQIHNIGFQLYQGKVSLSPKCVIVFELDQKMTSGKLEGKPMVLSKQFQMYMKPGSNLRLFIEAWRKKPLTDEQAYSYDLSKLLNAPATLVITHKAKKNGEMKAEIAGISPAKPEAGTVPVTYTETPDWIIKSKAEAVQPQGQKDDSDF